MNTDLHRRAGEVFVQVRELRGSAREDRLLELCRDDPALLAEARSLLTHDGGDAAIDAPLSAAKLAQALAPGAMASPDRIGRFRILGVLGQGGMGVVYRAEQEHPRRMVALKIIRSLAPNPTLERRFEREAEALARLQHPGIAQVFEVGHAPTPTGPCPYLAMELVEGPTITDHARAAGLDPRARLALLAQVADAVHHAHTKGVIHRDLKPANILVSQGTGGSQALAGGGLTDSAQPKVLDFGVARVLDDHAEMTAITDPGQLIGTVRYMSPEQLGGDTHAADVRSDVYALGLIGYELLAGRLPYDLDGRALGDVTRIIREVEPVPLGRLDRSLAGDPEIILAKALEKDAARRYPSVAELAADLRRFLADQPIAARPASATYQFRKFARRNRALVVGAGVAVLALMAIAAVSVSAAIVTARARDVADAQRIAAEREADKSRRALEFLRTMLSAADPNRAETDVKVVTVLDRASTDAGTTFADQPESEAMIRYTLGSAYEALGRDQQAVQELELAVQLRTTALGSDHADTIDARLKLAEVLTQSRRSQEARPILDAVLRRFSPDSISPTVPRALNLIGQVHVLEGRYADAEAAFRRAIELGTRTEIGLAGGASFQTNLGLALELQGRLQEAEPVQRTAAAMHEQAWGPMHDRTLTARGQLASLWNKMGRGEEAIKELERIHEVRRSAFGSEHPSTLTAASNLGNALITAKRYAESADILKPTFDALRRTLPVDDERPYTCANNLGTAYLFLGRNAEAEVVYREVLEAQQRILGSRHQKTLTTSNNLAKSLHRQGRYAEAEAIYRELIPVAEAALPPGMWVLGGYKLGHGQALTELGRHKEAEPLLLDALRILEAGLGENHPNLAIARKAAADLYKAWGRPEKAAQYEAK